ncbi:MAG: polysaccharide deacetylase family protein [Candidatus Bathyarchaeota archaeon]|nr:polysaccharide deacetylase family protein [Candidatus Bathyarchaeota archaeon]
MKNKGTAILIIVLVCFFAALTYTITADMDALFAPAPPTQVYGPTVPEADQKVVCIAFDDGWKSHLDAAAILDKYNYKATYAIITSYVGYPAYLDWAQIRELAGKGNDIVSHTQTHCNLSATDSATLQAELAGSQETLRSHGYAADVLIYPYGEAATNDTVRAAVAQYYLLARGTDWGKCDLYTLDRYNVESYSIYQATTLEEFAGYLEGTAGNDVTVLFYHKVGDSQDNAVSLAAFEAQMQFLKDNGYVVRTVSEQFLKPQ